MRPDLFYRPRRSFLRFCAIATLLPLAAIPRLAAQAYDPPATYYATASGTGPTLKASLHAIIDGHIKLPYTSSSTDVWDAVKVLDADPANSANVLLLYSSVSRDNTHQEGSTSASNTWNREHVWPLSLGPDTTGTTAGTDLHHLYACDTTVNANRGNLPFDTLAPGGTPDPEAPESRRSGVAWEPRDADKGRLARALFYMAVRYEPGDDVGSVGDLELSESPSSTQMARLSTLLAWNRRFPISDLERLRNQRIYTTYQQNRNPFVDHPYYADMVFAGTTARGAWRNQKFTTAQLATPAVIADPADPDSDGLPNLLEYAFNLDPLVPDPAAAPAVAPATLTSGAAALALTYRRNRHASDLTYAIQRSTDLATWTTVTPEPVSTTRADVLTDTVTIRVGTLAPATFLRLQITSP